MFRLILRLGVILCLAAAAILLVAESGEYPGATRAGRLIALRELFPLAVIGWLNLAVLARSEGTPRPARSKALLAAATVANAALFVSTLPHARPGSAPIALAMPVIGAMLLVSVLGIAFDRRQGNSDNT